MKNTLQILSILLLALSVAYAQDASSPLASKLEAFLVVEGDGGVESLEPTTEILPNQVILYRIHYENVSDSALSGIKANGRIPPSTDILLESPTAIESPVEFSIDNGVAYSVPPIVYTKVLEDGSEVEAIATPEMYTDIRWTIPVLSAGESITLEYRVRVK